MNSIFNPKKPIFYGPVNFYSITRVSLSKMFGVVHLWQITDRIHNEIIYTIQSNDVVIIAEVAT